MEGFGGGRVRACQLDGTIQGQPLATLPRRFERRLSQSATASGYRRSQAGAVLGGGGRAHGSAQPGSTRRLYLTVEGKGGITDRIMLVAQVVENEG